jgi:hypothetical protein
MLLLAKSLPLEAWASNEKVAVSRRRAAATVRIGIRQHSSPR